MSVSQPKKLIPRPRPRPRPTVQYTQTKDGIKFTFPNKSAFDQTLKYLKTKYNLNNLVINQSSSSYSYSSYSSSTGKTPITQNNSYNKQEYSIFIPNEELKKIDKLIL